MSELCIACLPPRANVPASCMWQTNAFTAMRGDKTAMRPFAELLFYYINCLSERIRGGYTLEVVMTMCFTLLYFALDTCYRAIN